MGLTTPSFIEPSPARGESAVYTIFAVGASGISTASEAVTVTVPKPKMIHMEH